MYCFRCGKKLPPRVFTCPECDTPQKRRQRYRTRMILGLFIFLAGAVAGSLFDTVFFKGEAWDHSFVGMLDNDKAAAVASRTTLVTEPASLATISAQVVSSPENSDQQPVVASAAEVAANSETAADNALATASESVVESSAQQTVNASAGPEVSEEDSSVSAPPTSPAPDSTRLVFAEVKPLVKSDYSTYHAWVSRDLQELVFAGDKFKIGGKNLYQCFVANYNSTLEPERAFTWPGNVWTPELTPDRKKIIFSSDSRSPEHVFVYDRETSQSKPLTSGTSKNMMPAISPDGSLVAYVSNEKGNNDIWLIGLDGSNKLQITSGPEDDREPRWLPDGRGLVFTRIYDRLKKSHIMQIMLDPMGEPQALVAEGGRNWLADVAPDGRSVAFVRSLTDDGSKNTIIIKELINGKEKQIKPLGQAECFRPIWVADSSGLVFHANVNKSKNIYKASLQMENQD